MESTMTLLDPKTNIIQIAAAHVSEHIFKKLDAKKEAVNAGRKLYEAGKRTLDIPIQFSELMRMITKGRIKLNLEIMDSSVPLKTINHMVNKLVVGNRILRSAHGKLPDLYNRYDAQGARYTRHWVYRLYDRRIFGHVAAVYRVKGQTPVSIKKLYRNRILHNREYIKKENSTLLYIINSIRILFFASTPK